MLPSAESKVASLQEVLKTKEAEIEKYKKYLNKAKKIIESFGEGKSRAAEDSVEVCWTLTKTESTCNPLIIVFFRFRVLETS